MKFTRILALMLAGVMLALCMASCGGSAETVVSFKVTIKENGDFLADVASLKIPLKDPTVLDALKTASELCSFTYDLNDGETSVDAMMNEDGKYERCTDEETGLNYAWYFTINGEEPSGAASENVISDGDVVEYIYEAFEPKA